MTEKILINQRFGDLRAARVDEDGRLQQLWFSQAAVGFSSGAGGGEGEILAGRVQRVQAGLGAAFVDIGQDKAAFWPLRTQQVQQVRAGQMYLLQRQRAGKGDKGDKLSDRLSLAGLLMVLQPGAEKLALSRRIDDGDEADRLRALGQKIRPPGFSLILRAAAQGRDEQTLRAELQALLAQWQALQKLDVNARVPGPVQPQRSPARQIVEALLTPQCTQIVVDDHALWQSLRELFAALPLLPAEAVELYRRERPIFELYAVEAGIERALQRRHWLKSGAYLVFDQTEAMCTIDVNSGKSAQSGDFAGRSLRIDLEAAQAIARQLRLRNISGLVVVDFIDLPSRSAQKKVLAALREALHGDAARCRLSSMSEFGLVQISRQRRGPSLLEQLSEPCPACQGLGWRLARQVLAQDFLQQLFVHSQSSNAQKLSLLCQPGIAEFLRRHCSQDLQRLRKQCTATIEIISDPQLPWRHCKIELVDTHTR